MRSNSKNKKLMVLILGVVFVVLTIGITFAFINLTLVGEKRQVITAGTLSLELDEDENNLTIQNALPMYDEVGMLQDAFTFRLINNGTTSATYKLKLVEIGTGTLSKSDVKYGFTKDGVKTIGLLYDLPSDGIIDSGTIGASPATIEYSLRLWIKDTVTDNATINGKSLSYRVDIEVGQVVEESRSMNLAQILAERAQTPTEGMFNYTSEGYIMNAESGELECEKCTMNEETGEYESTEESITDGVYSMLDDDGMSYFYRGKADNLVQFGEYDQDYYVYRYDGDDYVSLEACQSALKSVGTCTKTKKYDAGTPMYWRIIRINGDGTIRMIYAGTTKDAIGEETGIGRSAYNKDYNDPKYTGYTYDRTTSETKSDAKKEIDNWYSTYLAPTEYDSYIAEGKFCSDSSDYGEVDLIGEIFGAFAPYKRGFTNTLGLGEAHPSFKCSETDQTYGGSYRLKAGLITLEEVIAAGGQMARNDSYYLYNGTEGNGDGGSFWTMSPSAYKYDEGFALVGYVIPNGGASDNNVYVDYPMLRPVINLKAGTAFQKGTDGSTTTPYQVFMNSSN